MGTGPTKTMVDHARRRYLGVSRSSATEAVEYLAELQRAQWNAGIRAAIDRARATLLRALAKVGAP